jgi:hypothetical protein
VQGLLLGGLVCGEQPDQGVEGVAAQFASATDHHQEEFFDPGVLGKQQVDHVVLGVGGRRDVTYTPTGGVPPGRGSYGRTGARR